MPNNPVFRFTTIHVRVFAGEIYHIASLPFVLAKMLMENPPCCNYSTPAHREQGSELSRRYSWTNVRVELQELLKGRGNVWFRNIRISEIYAYSQSIQSSGWEKTYLAVRTIV